MRLCRLAPSNFKVLSKLRLSPNFYSIVADAGGQALSAFSELFRRKEVSNVGNSQPQKQVVAMSQRARDVVFRDGFSEEELRCPASSGTRSRGTRSRAPQPRNPSGEPACSAERRCPGGRRKRRRVSLVSDLFLQSNEGRAAGRLPRRALRQRDSPLLGESRPANASASPLQVGAALAALPQERNGPEVSPGSGRARAGDVCVPTPGSAASTSRAFSRRSSTPR